MRKILNFIDKFKVTKRFTIFVASIVGLSLFILQTEGAEKLGFFNIPKQYVFKFDQILVIFLLPGIALLEGIQIFVGPRIQQVSNLLKPVLSFITSAMNLFFDFVYVKPVSFLIRPGVKRVLDESGFYSTEREFIFRSQKRGQRDDDHYFPETFELNDLTLINIKILPKSTGRWRFGFKFSQDRNFPNARYDKDHPLLHLTKDQGDTKLNVHFYKGDSSKPSVHELWTSYKNQEITIELLNSGKSTNVMIFPIQEGKRYGTLLKRWRYFQVFAWADEVSSFQIGAKIKIISLG